MKVLTYIINVALTHTGGNITILPATVGDDDVPVDVNGRADLDGNLLLHLLERDLLQGRN